MGPPAGSFRHVVCRQLPPAHDRGIVQARGEESPTVDGKCEPGPSRRVVNDSPDAPGSKVDHCCLGRAFAARDRDELAIGRYRTPAGRGRLHSKSAEPGLRELDGEVAVGAADDLETALSEDDQPVAAELKPPGGLRRAPGELTPVDDRKKTQLVGTSDVDDLTTIGRDGTQRVRNSVGGDDSRLSSFDLNEDLSIHRCDRRGIGPWTGKPS